MGDEKIWPLRFPRWLVASDLVRHWTLREWRIFSALLEFENTRTHRCWPKVETLVRRSGYGRRSVIEAIKALELLGAVQVIRRKGKVNEYEIFQSPPGTSAIKFALPQAEKRASGGVVQTVCTTTSADKSAPLPMQPFRGDSHRNSSSLESLEEEPKSPPTSWVPPPNASSPPSEVGALATEEEAQTGENMEKEKDTAEKKPAQKTPFAEFVEGKNNEHSRAVPVGLDSGESAFKKIQDQIARGNGEERRK